MWERQCILIRTHGQDIHVMCVALGGPRLFRVRPLGIPGVQFKLPPTSAHSVAASHDLSQAGLRCGTRFSTPVRGLHPHSRNMYIIIVYNCNNCNTIKYDPYCYYSDSMWLYVTLCDSSGPSMWQFNDVLWACAIQRRHRQWSDALPWGYLCYRRSWSRNVESTFAASFSFFVPLFSRKGRFQKHFVHQSVGRQASVMQVRQGLILGAAFSPTAARLRTTALQAMKGIFMSHSGGLTRGSVISQTMSDSCQT